MPSTDVLAFGESMISFAPSGSQSLSVGAAFSSSIAGAESNVAAHLAARGHTVAWASRLGDDPFGRRIRRSLDRAGIDTHLVEFLPDRSTGVMFKDPARETTTVHYYRSGSAASSMDPDFARRVEMSDVRVVHVSGVTPALSPTCAAAVDALMDDAVAAGVMVSFDVNYRPILWSEGDASERLLAIARRSDVCFVGLDEAAALWSTITPDDVRALISEPRMLVVKDGAVGVTLFYGEDRLFSPALPVEVVEAVGAGDAFAAGFLAGLLENSTLAESLQLGHTTARGVLASMSDVPFLEEVSR